MSRYSLLQRLPAVISTPISTLLSIAVAKYLIANHIVEGILWLMVAALFLFLIFFFDQLIRIGLSHFTWLRKFILKGDFIEGVWCEELLSASRATGTSGVEVNDIFVMIIRPSDSSYEVTAYIFNDHGIEKGHSRSRFAQYQAGTLLYYFEGPWSEAGKVRTIQGFANITFASTTDRRPPAQFSGNVAEFGEEMSQVQINGYRLQDKIYPEAFPSLQKFAMAVRQISRSIKNTSP